MPARAGWPGHADLAPSPKRADPQQAKFRLGVRVREACVCHVYFAESQDCCQKAAAGAYGEKQDEPQAFSLRIHGVQSN
jgi:hypothetical protein